LHTHGIFLPVSAGSGSEIARRRHQGRGEIKGPNAIRLANEFSVARARLRDKKTSESCHFAAEDSLVTKMHGGNEPSAAMSVFQVTESQGRCQRFRLGSGKIITYCTSLIIHNILPGASAGMTGRLACEEEARPTHSQVNSSTRIL
jgi:hypothetical protein